jgi:hypothetical protein
MNNELVLEQKLSFCKKLSFLEILEQKLSFCKKLSFLEIPTLT